MYTAPVNSKTIAITAADWSRCAENYDNKVDAFTGPHALACLQHVKLSSDMTVLDVACGNGVLSLAVAASVARVYATDYSEAFVNIVKQRVAERGLENKVTALVQDGCTLDAIGDASCDVVFCSFGLFFMPDMQQACKQMYRVLKPGGRLLLTTWSTYEASSFHRVMAQLGQALAGEPVTDLSTLAAWQPVPTAELPPAKWLPDPQQVHTLCTAAGFTDCVSVAHSSNTPLYNDLNTFLDTLNATPNQTALYQKIAGRREEAMLKLKKIIHVQNETGEAFQFELCSWIHSANKPAASRV